MEKDSFGPASSPDKHLDLFIQLASVFNTVDIHLQQALFVVDIL